jgi:DNA-directed RNA polymerase specialized sigma24 family protein
MVGPSRARRAAQQTRMDDVSDLQPLASAARGDSDAFGAFYTPHVRSLLAFFVQRTGAPETAADLAHETRVAALSGLASYRGDGAPAAWLYGIARRKLALERLPEPQREAIRARMLDELEYPEIARGLRCSEAVVRQRVSRGLRVLRTEAERGGQAL